MTPEVGLQTDPLKYPVGKPACHSRHSKVVDSRGIQATRRGGETEETEK